METQYKTCPSCEMKTPEAMEYCPICDYEFPRKGRWVKLIAFLLAIFFLILHFV